MGFIFNGIPAATSSVAITGGVSKEYFDPDKLIQNNTQVVGTALTTVYNNATGVIVYIDDITIAWSTTSAASSGIRVGIYESDGTTLVVDIVHLVGTAAVGLMGSINTPSGFFKFETGIALENGRMIRTQNGIANDVTAVNVLGHIA